MLGITMATMMRGVTTPAITANTTSTVGGASQTVSLPAHSAGQLLLVFFATTGNPSHTINTGSSVGTWNQMQTIGLGTTLRFSTYKCSATDSNMSLVVDVSGSQTHRAIAYAIDNADTVNYGTYVQVNAAGSPNPPSLTLTNNPRNAIFFPVAYCTLTTWNPVTLPANYSNKILNSGSGGSIICMDRTISNATTEDPGIYGNISTSLGITNTYAVYKA